MHLKRSKIIKLFGVIQQMLSEHLHSTIMFLHTNTHMSACSLIHSTDTNLVTTKWDPQVVQSVKSLPARWEIFVQSLGWEEPLGKKMATRTSILAGPYSAVSNLDLPYFLSPSPESPYLSPHPSIFLSNTFSLQ